MTPYPYSFKDFNQQFSGELYTETGSYSGGSVETQTTTTYKNNRVDSVKTQSWTTINVRLPSGKVRSVVAKGNRNIPNDTLITLFYAKKGEDYLPHHYAVHAQDKYFQLSEKAVKKAALAILGWNPMRRLWSWLVDGATWLVGLAIAVAFGMWTNNAWGWEFLAFFAGVFCWIAAVIGVSIPAKFLGGSIWLTNSIGKELADCVSMRSKELIDKYDALTANHQQDLVIDSGFGAGIADGAAKSADGEVDYKPMY